MLTVILSISLYAPQVAKFLAYAECSALVLTMADQDWCDCMLTADNDTDGIPATEKQKDIILKTDWKCVVEPAFFIPQLQLPLFDPHTAFLSGSLVFPFKTPVFRPPLVG